MSVIVSSLKYESISASLFSSDASYTAVSSISEVAAKRRSIYKGSIAGLRIVPLLKLLKAAVLSV
jgi:hypothetical protein